MEETPLQRIVHAVVFLAICAVIVLLGWNEPLSYRFMTPLEIAKAEGRSVTEPQATPNWVAQRFRGSRLDEPAKQVPRGGQSGYSRY